MKFMILIVLQKKHRRHPFDTALSLYMYKVFLATVDEAGSAGGAIVVGNAGQEQAGRN